MDTDWCLGCETRLTRDVVFSGYCSQRCYYANTGDHAAYRHQPVFESSSSSGSDDEDEQDDLFRQPSTSTRPPSRVERIKAWAASVPACAGHPHLLPPPMPPPASRSASLQGFSRPALLRRHSALRPTPPSTFVSKTRPVPTSTSPSSSPLSARARPSPPQPSIVGSPSVASSLLAPPARMLSRIRSWVRSDGSPATPVVEQDEPPTPKLVTLDDAASTSTLVDDVSAPEKLPSADLVPASPAATLPAEELSRLVLGARSRHRASRVKLADAAGDLLPQPRLHATQLYF